MQKAGAQVTAFDKASDKATGMLLSEVVVGDIYALEMVFSVS